MPTALGASRRHISAIAVVAVVITATALVGAAAIAGLVVAAPATATVAFLLAVLLGGAEELEGTFGHRVVFVRGGVDFLFRAGIDSVPGKVVVATLLQLFLEQELEVLAVGLGFVVFRDDPEVKLLCIPMQRSERLVRRRRDVFRRRLSEMGSREATEELEEEGERGEPMELEPEEEEIAMGIGGLGALRCLAEGGRRVCGERSRFRVRLNRKKWKMNRHFHILRGAGCRDVASSVVVVVRFNEHQ